MVTWVFSLCFMLLAPLAFAAENAPQRHGLMWNRTGLPAVFPLQDKTAVVQDYLLQLKDAQTGDTALAAYINGARFFRVLVPPGTYDVQIAYGAKWQDEAALFGADGPTQTVSLSVPLIFAVRNFSTKGCHMLNLSELAPGQEPRIKGAPQMLCQSYRFARRMAPRVARAPETWPGPLEVFATPLEALEAELNLDLSYPVFSEEEKTPHKRPQLRVWTRSC